MSAPILGSGVFGLETTKYRTVELTAVITVESIGTISVNGSDTDIIFILYLFSYIPSELESDSDPDTYHIQKRMRIISITNTNVYISNTGRDG
jgi:hypothetical protein